MRTPVFFAPAVLIFWGWQMETWWLAIVMAAVLVYANQSKNKYEFSAGDFNKFVDISIVLVAGLVVLGLSIESKTAVWFLLKWLPAAFFPVIGVQYFSLDGKISFQSFLLASRQNKRGRKIPKNLSDKKINFTFIYALICLLCAGVSKINPEYSSSTPGISALQTVTDQDRLIYFIGCSALLCWGMWGRRSKRVPVWCWSLMMAAVILSGYWGQKMVRSAGLHLRHWMMARYVAMASNNPLKSSTAMGEIGQLKLSNAIIMRVKLASDSTSGNFLLQKAVYTQLLKETWVTRSDFKPIEPSAEKDVWVLNPMKGNMHRMMIFSKSKRSRAVLVLPPGTNKISNLKVENCYKNSLQTVKVEGVPAFMAVDVNYTGSPDGDSRPVKADLNLPEGHAQLLEEIIQDLGLRNLTKEKAIKKIEFFFNDQFEYSLDLAGKGVYETPLHNFLTHTRKGHCELFASATVLLLRKAGIPARYATGFIVNEYSEMEQKYIVRQRDAHAWARVFVNDNWHDIDTTPSGFLAVDRLETPSSPVKDFLSYLLFGVSVLRYETGKDILEKYGFWLILPLAAILWYRLRQSSRIRKAVDNKKRTQKKDDKRVKESFYLLETHLNDQGLVRYKYETYTTWLNRIRPSLPPETDVELFEKLLRLHNKMVFGPGLIEQEKIFLFKTIRTMVEVGQLIK